MEEPLNAEVEEPAAEELSFAEALPLQARPEESEFAGNFNARVVGGLKSSAAVGTRADRVWRAAQRQYPALTEIVSENPGRQARWERFVQLRLAG